MAARRKSHREAQRKYRQSEKGKKAHRQAENRRRQAKNQNQHKNMDDPPSTPLRPWVKQLSTRTKYHSINIDLEPKCHFCGAGGQIVGRFPRRGYG